MSPCSKHYKRSIRKPGILYCNISRDMSQIFVKIIYPDLSTTDITIIEIFVDDTASTECTEYTKKKNLIKTWLKK